MLSFAYNELYLSSRTVSDFMMVTCKFKYETELSGDDCISGEVVMDVVIMNIVNRKPVL